MEQFLIIMGIIYLAIGVFCAAANRRYWKLQAKQYPDIAQHLLEDQWVDFLFESLTQPAELLFSSPGRRAFFYRLGADQAKVGQSVQLHAGKVGRGAEFVTSCKECGNTFPLADAGYISNRSGLLCPACFVASSKFGGSGGISYWGGMSNCQHSPTLEELLGKDLTRH
jgi:hypothetical protein